MYIIHIVLQQHLWTQFQWKVNVLLIEICADGKTWQRTPFGERVNWQRRWTIKLLHPLPPLRHPFLCTQNQDNQITHSVIDSILENRSPGDWRLPIQDLPICRTIPSELQVSSSFFSFFSFFLLHPLIPLFHFPFFLSIAYIHPSFLSILSLFLFSFLPHSSFCFQTNPLI